MYVHKLENWLSIIDMYGKKIVDIIFYMKEGAGDLIGTKTMHVQNQNKQG